MPSLALGDNFVDLGLPSGTLWSDHNVGAATSSERGYFYAWGETQCERDGKLYYRQDNYKYASVPSESYWGPQYLTKYYSGDGYTSLLSVDDPSSQYYSAGVMPTDLQMKELLTECTWTKNADNSVTVTGTNGRSITLPAGGYRYDDKNYDQSVCYYWCRDVYHSNGSYSYECACHLTFNGQKPSCSYNSGLGGFNLFYGMLIRPVSSSKASRTAVTGITISGSTVLDLGSTTKLTATCTPSTASSKKVWWTTSDYTVADVDENGNVTAKKTGTATITAIAKDDKGAKKSITVTVVSNVIGTGTTARSGRYPYFTSENYSTSELIYSKDEIGRDVTINAISFEVSTASAYATSSVKVYMGYKSTSSFSSETDYVSSSSLTLVYSGSPAVGITSGWEKIILNTPFTYTRSKGNLVIVICKSSDSTNSSVKYLCNSTSGYSALCKSGYSTTYADPSNTSSFVRYGERPNLKIETSAQVAVTGVTISGSSSVNVDKTLQLSASVSPSSASQSVVWASSNTAVATVSSSGLVTGKGTGTAVIYCRAADCCNGSSSKTVTVSYGAQATSITITGQSEVYLRGEIMLSATVSPSQANSAVTWSSSNTNIATIDADGVVTGKAIGTVTITATAKDGSGVKQTKTITVINPVQSISLSANTLNMNVGQSTSLSVQYYPADAENRSVQWYSSNTAVATVSSTGVVTAKGVGTANIQAITPNSVMDQCVVSVVEPEIIGTGTSSDYKAPYCNYYKYSTSQIIYPKEVMVEGKITAISFQVATASSYTASLNIYMGYVSNSTFTSASSSVSSGLTEVFSGSKTLGTATGWEKVTLITPFTYEKSKGNLIIVVCHSASSYNGTLKYYYSSATNSVLYRQSDSSTSYSSYTTTGSYNLDNQRPNIKFEVEKEVPVTSISVTGTTSIAEGATTTLTATCSPSNATNKSITWSSSNTAVATVSTSGVVTGKAVGSAVITATAANGVKKEVTVTVSHAAFSNGFCSQCGTYEAPTLSNGCYEINNAGKLYWFAQKVNSGSTTINGKLTANITVNTNVLNSSGDLNGTPSRSWIGIGTSTYKYGGYFYGEGYTISGLYCNTNDNMGFFRFVNGAHINNVTIKDSYFKGFSTGGICGYSVNSQFIGCNNYATISCGSDDEAGGIVGYCEHSNIDLCNNYGKIIGGSDSSCGGICGYCCNSYNSSYADGHIAGCINYGSISGSLNNAGGIAGRGLYYLIKYCGSYGSVTSSKGYKGSICGSAIESKEVVQGSYSSYTYYYRCEIKRCLAKPVSGLNICGYWNGTKVEYNNYTISSTTGKEAYQINSLGLDASDYKWYQNIDNGKTADAYPVLDNTHGEIYGMTSLDFYTNSPIVPATSVTISMASESAVGQTVTASATISPTNATVNSASFKAKNIKPVTWTSGYTSLATINSTTGALTAKGKGTATITAKVLDGSNVTQTKNLRVYLLGDANGNDKVNVADVATIAAYKNSITPASWHFAPANANFTDSEINVADITSTLNIVWNGVPYSAPKRVPGENVQQSVSLYGQPVYLTADGMSKLNIVVDNQNTQFTAFEFVMRLPEGVHVKRNADGALSAHICIERTSAEKTDYISACENEDGSVSVLCYSTNLEYFEGNTGCVATIELEADADLQNGEYLIAFDRALLSGCGDLMVADIHDTEVIVGNASDIGITGAESQDATYVYDVNGRMMIVDGNPVHSIEKLPKGIYIINGNKVTK